MKRFAYPVEEEPVGPGGSADVYAICPILPLTDEGFYAAAAEQGMTPDQADSYGILRGDGIVRRVQEELIRNGVAPAGLPPIYPHGCYDRQTLVGLRQWAQARGLLDDKFLSYACGSYVTSCALYRSLGLQCERTFIVRNVTPSWGLLQETVEKGELDLRCSGIYDSYPPGSSTDSGINWTRVGLFIGAAMLAGVAGYYLIGKLARR